MIAVTTTTQHDGGRPMIGVQQVPTMPVSRGWGIRIISWTSSPHLVGSKPPSHPPPPPAHTPLTAPRGQCRPPHESIE